MSQYVIYLRKSRMDIEAEARGEGETLARHENALKDLAQKYALPVAAVYREVVSGETIAARPAMQQLLTEVEQGRWTGVLVMEIERLARGDTIDQGIVAQAFRVSGTSIITPFKTYNPANEFDEEYFEFGLFMSRREYKTINRRLQQGRLASAKEGKYVGNRAPYGYERIKLERGKGFTLQPHAQQADIVRTIFALYTTGEPQPDGSLKRMGICRIAQRLNEMGIRPMIADKWSASSIRDILINPVYIGKIRWNWRPVLKRMEGGSIVNGRPRSSNEKCIIIDGLHDGIVDEKVFTAAQQHMATNSHRPIAGKHITQNPLAGIITCADCGRRLSRRPYKATPAMLVCPNPECHNIGSYLHYVEERLLRILDELLGNQAIEWSPPACNIDTFADIKMQAAKSIESRIASLNKQLNKTYDLLEQGVYDTTTFLSREEKLKKEIDEAFLLKEQAANELHSRKSIDAMSYQMKPLKGRLIDVYHQLPDAHAKNNFLSGFIEKAEYKKTTRSKRGGSPYNFELVVYLK